MSKEEEEMEFTVSELEEILQNGAKVRNKAWSHREDAILQRYYGQVPTRALVKHLEGRSIGAIRLRAQRIGLVFSK
jgi:hypothetical protein